MLVIWTATAQFGQMKIVRTCLGEESLRFLAITGLISPNRHLGPEHTHPLKVGPDFLGK